MVAGQLQQGQCELTTCWLLHFHFRCSRFLAVLGDWAGLLPLVLGGALTVWGIWADEREEPVLS